MIDVFPAITNRHSMSIRNLFTKIKSMATDAVKGPLTLPLEESLLNSVISRLVREADGPIRSLNLKFSEGACIATAGVLRNGIAAQVSVQFTVTQFQVDSAQQVITFHRIGEMTLDGDDVWSKVVVMVVKAIVSSLLRQDLLSHILKENPAVTVDGPNISVDLSRLGIGEKIIEAVTEHWLAGNPAIKTLLQGMAEKGGAKLLQQVSIIGARCTNTGLEVDVQLATKS